MNPYEKLHEIVRLLDVRFPDGKDIFQRVSRLAEETGELAQAVNHTEGTGIKREKYGEPDRNEMVKEIQDVMRAALGIAQHYGLEAELEKSIDDAYVRLSSLSNKL
jgi:NTP pyrophosphatase (non-canonical NTP hydrolase)